MKNEIKYEYKRGKGPGGQHNVSPQPMFPLASQLRPTDGANILISVMPQNVLWRLCLPKDALDWNNVRKTVELQRSSKLTVSGLMTIREVLSSITVQVRQQALKTSS